MIFDAHAHYNDKKFDDRDTLLSSLFEDRLGAVVNASVTPEDSRRSIELAEKYDRVFAAVGIHPGDIDRAGELNDAISEIRKLAAHPKTVAIGEIGLDYYWEPYDKEKQKAYFIAQLELARELKLPVVIHDREAHGDVDAIIRDYTDVKILLHCYSGSAEWAR